MTDVVLGPMLRYVDGERATVWVETDGPCEVSVLVGEQEVAHRAPTFHVEGHHFALVTVTGLTPGTVTPYRVACDGAPVWPRLYDDLPPPLVPTPDGERVRLVFGSCRSAAPVRPPWNLDYDQDERGRGPDALVAYAARLRETRTTTGRTSCCCSATRSTPTTRRHAPAGSSAAGATRTSRRARRSPGSRSTRGCTGSPGPSRTSAGCCRPCRRR